MRTLHVHIGAHKTGTTAIQRFLVESADALAAQGVAVPAGGIGPEWGHHQIAWEMFGWAEPGPLDEVLKEISGAEQAVISSEDFGLLGERHVERFTRRCAAAGWEPRFIRFHRRSGDALVAFHYTLGRMRIAMRFSRMLAGAVATGRVVSTDGRIYHLRRADFARQWPAAVVEVDYDDAKSDLIGAFCRVIGVDVPVAFICEHVNVTPRDWRYRARRAVARSLLG